MRQLPERLFLVLLLLLSLPVFNPVSGAFRAASFEWQEDRKGTFQLPLLIPEIEEECESEEDNKEDSASDFLRPDFFDFQFHKDSAGFFAGIASIPEFRFITSGGKRGLQLFCVWLI